MPPERGGELRLIHPIEVAILTGELRLSSDLGYNLVAL